VGAGAQAFFAKTPIELGTSEAGTACGVLPNLQATSRSESVAYCGARELGGVTDGNNLVAARISGSLSEP